ncbi:hypothetical protein HispidOSU_009561 [Sigmodon hispidus]
MASPVTAAALASSWIQPVLHSTRRSSSSSHDRPRGSVENQPIPALTRPGDLNWRACTSGNCGNPAPRYQPQPTDRKPVSQQLRKFFPGFPLNSPTASCTDLLHVASLLFRLSALASVPGGLHCALTVCRAKTPRVDAGERV